MFKHLSICAALVALAAAPTHAQQQEAVLRKVEVPGAPFNLIFAMPKPGGTTYSLARSPEALLVHLIGGELALGFDGETEMLKALNSLQLPVCSFHVENKDSNFRKPVAVYIVPKGE